MTSVRVGLFLAAAALAAGAAAAQAGDPLGLVSRYQAEGNTSDALGANSATAVGNVTYVPGALGQAFSFDGASYVEVANPTFDRYASGFTVTAWIEMASYSNPASAINLRTNANASGFTLEQFFGRDGTLLFAVNNTGVAEGFEVLSAPGWRTGVLYHVAASFDAASGSMVLYRDGKAVAWRHDLPKKKMAVPPGGTNVFQIGHNIRATAAFWRGRIDDVRFYGRALTAGEVGSLASRTALVAHWRFDEQPGATVARDDLGTYDGTLAGGAAFAAGGIAGNCVSLAETTNSLVNMGSSFPTFTSGDFTVVAWVKATSIAQDSLALSKHEAFVSNGYLLAVSATGGGGAAGRATFYASDPQVAQSPVSATPIDDGVWHQLVGVYRAGATHSIYVDGAPLEAATPSAPVTDRGAPFIVGGVNENGSPDPRYTGQIDDVQVYASALTDAQIQYLFSHPGRPLPDAQYDLATDWSDDANPNGTWIYREGTNALPHVASWGNPAYWSGAQPAWARSAETAGGSGGNFIPAWMKDRDLDLQQLDVLVGDVVVHTTSPDNGVGNGPANVVWRSPFAGVVDVSGAVWPGRDIGRSNRWSLYRNATLLTQGAIGSGDAYDRAHPFALATGSGGGAALRDIAVAPGDELRLEFVADGIGDYAGVEFAVNVPAGRRVVSYFLPKTVKLKLAGAGKDSLVVSGFFDDGGAAVDFAQPVTIEVGLYSTGPVALTAKGAAFVHKDENLALTVKPRLKGSSRGSFKLTLKNATLADLVDPAGEVPLHFRAAGLSDAQGGVRLTNGAYTLGKVRGALVAPAFFPAKATITANDGKPDAVALTAGFAHEGPTPAALGRVRVALGSVFDVTLDGDDFTKSGDKFVHKDAALAVTVDFAKEVVIVKAKGIEVGALAGPTEVFLLDLGLGAGPVTTRVRLGSSGPKRFY